jgi:hypothetical protein
VRLHQALLSHLYVINDVEPIRTLLAFQVSNIRRGWCMFSMIVWRGINGCDPSFDVSDSVRAASELAFFHSGRGFVV